MKIARAVLDRLHAQLESGYPQEACGFLLGQDREVRDIFAAENRRSDSPRNRYLMDADAYQRVSREARQRGLEIIGFYHSHPDVPARPSAFDLENATWPGYSYVIVSVVKGRAVETNSWQLREGVHQFEPEPVEIGG